MDVYRRPLRPDELMHHGVLGQKWGIRRYQNKDGTLTAAGRKRSNKYENSDGTLTGKGKKLKNLATSQFDKTVQRSSAEKDQSKEDYNYFKKTNSKSAVIADEGEHYLRTIYRNSLDKNISGAIEKGELKPGTDYIDKYIPNSGLLKNKKEIAFTDKGNEKLLDIADKTMISYEKENKKLIKEVNGYKDKAQKEVDEYIRNESIRTKEQLLKQGYSKKKVSDIINDPEYKDLLSFEFWDNVH